MKLQKVVRGWLEKLCDIKYRKKLKKYKLSYEAWVKEMESMGGCNADSADCMDIARNVHHGADVADAGKNGCDFKLLTLTAGTWTKDAHARIAAYFAAHPEVQLVYTDEDVQLSNDRYGNPWLKPDWSPDTYLWKDYLGGAVAVRNSLYAQLTEEEKKSEMLCHDRLTALAGGFTKGCRSIGHLWGICFHREEGWKRAGEACEENGATASKATSAADAAKVGSTSEMPEVSVIIPSKDNLPVLNRCLETFCHTVQETTYEIIIVDNGSCEHTRIATEEKTEKLNQELTSNKNFRGIQYHFEPMEFNFARMCNIGAGLAKGGLLLFLNDDIEAVEKGWLEAMTAKARLPWAGAVGMKLRYPNSNKLQHAGITNIGIGPVHKLQFLKDNERYYDNRNGGVRNVLAVTGACMMLSRDVFSEAGGFAEELQVAFNDVDLCFTLYEKGYHNIVINTHYLLHHESLSRGADESEEKLKRLFRERNILGRRHPDLEGRDPYYHPWLNGNGLDTEIVPAYEEGRVFSDDRAFEETEGLKGIRREECLLLRIEYADAEGMQGYAVVLGSDNACFEKKLIFRSKAKSEHCYGMQFTEQYRHDLEKNMPDQKNVALCGFKVKFASALPPGEYRIGVLAKDRISGQKLLNWSNRVLDVR